MKSIQDASEIQRLLKEHAVLEQFDTKELTFQCYSYQKGEVISSPLNPTEDILILISGSAQIYDLREDGTRLPVGCIVNEAVIGDMEFITGCQTTFFIEASEECLCLALPRERYQRVLHQDVSFLHFLLKEMTAKLISSLNLEITTSTLEEKVLQYLQQEAPEQEITQVETMLFQLRCGRRELQRILKKLCDEGRLERLGRGHYRLAADLSEQRVP